jgi:hypothetical protein
MGILDDAIREHLELKRAHGASEEELRQQEVEALGAPPAPEPEDLEEAPEADLEHDAEPADGNGAAPLAEEVLEEEPEALEEPEPFAEPEPEPEPEPLPEPEPEAEFDEPEGDPEPRSGDTPARGFAALEEEDDEPEAASEDDADVLEDTPDFLQETPEHDRLWFEQKPPRDFDFD